MANLLLFGSVLPEPDVTTLACGFGAKLSLTLRTFLGKTIPSKMPHFLHT